MSKFFTYEERLTLQKYLKRSVAGLKSSVPTLADIPGGMKIQANVVKKMLPSTITPANTAIGNSTLTVISSENIAVTTVI